MPERKGLLLPASRGERPIFDGGRTPVAYSIMLHTSIFSIVFVVHGLSVNYAWPLPQATVCLMGVVTSANDVRDCGVSIL